MTGLSDKQLVQQVKEGDSSAFGELVERYQKPIFNAALRMVKEYDDAQDIAQTAFVKAYEKIDSYDPAYEFFSWIYRITINESLNLLNARKPTVDVDQNVASRGHTPEDDLYQSELSDRVQESLMELTDENRVVIVMKHFMDFTYREMSEILFIEEKTVKSRLFSARQKLSEIMNTSGITTCD